MLINVRAKARVNQKSRLRMPHENRRHPVFVTSAPTPAAISEGLPRWHFAGLEDRKRDLRQLRRIGPAVRSFRRGSLVRRHVQFHRREGVSQQRQQQDHDYSRDLQRRFYHFLHRHISSLVTRPPGITGPLASIGRFTVSMAPLIY